MLFRSIGFIFLKLAMSQQKHIDISAMRHSAAHLMASAIQELYPEAKFGVGPVIENGFYYDLDLPTPLSENDLAKIEKRMKKIQQRNDKFVREELSIDEAIKFFEERQQTYKVELLRALKEKGSTAIDADDTFDIDPSAKEVTSTYTHGSFVDLCRGPHVDSTGEIGVYKLMRVAGAYWRGKETNPMLQRVYGVCFATPEDLDEHLRLLEEAKKRDHRKIGLQQELFLFDDLVGKGLPMWLPKGNIMKEQVELLAKEVEGKYGYERVTTPVMGKKELFETSGHLPYYAGGMYPPMEMDDGTYYLKAMNCPLHHLIYRHRPRSYRELPLRFAEYGTVYRNELSGALAGLLRVRMLSMNDAHIYCSREQIESEFTSVLKMTREYFELFGLKDYWFRLSKWDANHKEKYIDQPDNWDYAEEVLRSVMLKENLPFTEVEDEAAFYGPKVDVQFKSVIGREESMSTIQLDFLARERFGLTYVNDKGEQDNNVFVIHRAPLSTHERFMAFLIEHYAGAYPVWLSPVQVKVIPVGESHRGAASALGELLSEAGVRVEVNRADETVGNQIRKAREEKVPYMLVIGDKEMPSNGDWSSSETLSIKVRGKEELVSMSLGDFVTQVTEEVRERRDK